VLDLPVAHVFDDEEPEERSRPDRAFEVLPALPEAHSASGDEIIMVLTESGHGQLLGAQIEPHTAVAQLVEHWSPKPAVESSSLSRRAGMQ
jgi:hypothetical protein